MKKGTPRHPKVKELARALKINPAWAVGILEMLWHFTLEFCPEGDIGRFTDSAIAEELLWDRDPGELISALVQSRWVDTSDDYRLIVHDWIEHCEDYAHVKVARAKHWFCDGTKPKLTRLNALERKEIEEFYLKSVFCAHKSSINAHKNVLPCRAVPMPCHALPTTLCVQPETAPAIPQEEVFLTFQTTGKDKRPYILTKAKVQQFKSDFPGIDVESQCRAARAWNENNPQKRKTYTGMPRFICSWLTNAQNRPSMPAPNGLKPALNAIPRAIPSVTPLRPLLPFDALLLAKKRVIELAHRVLKPSECRNLGTDDALISEMRVKQSESAEIKELIAAELNFEQEKAIPF